MNHSYYFTTESVFEGHPDKVADQLSDAILDNYLKEDPDSSVACEVLISKDIVILAGEVISTATFDKKKCVADLFEEVGYRTAKERLLNDQLQFLPRLHEQSIVLRQNVESGSAGDQGLMFGYASDETKELMPLGYSLCQKIVLHFAQLRRAHPFLGSDGKVQITLEYSSKNVIKRIKTLVLSCQHTSAISLQEVRSFIQKELNSLLPENLVDHETKFLINPGGSFIEGGIDADTGLTGRKIIVDTYGGYARHGGGAFSGKDPTKVDRIGAYMARYIAKNLVAHHFAKRAEVQLSYCLGLKDPVSVFVETFQTALKSPEEIESFIKDNFALSCSAIISTFNLRRPIYRKTAFGGHFGRENEGFLWEAIL